MITKDRQTLRDVPDFLLEQAVLGELPPEELERISALPGFGEYRERILADNRAILERYPAERMTATIRRRSLAAFSWVKLSGVVLPLAAAATLALVFLQPGSGALAALGDGAPDVSRAKGGSNSAVSESALAAARRQRLEELRAAAGLVGGANAAEVLTISVRSPKELLRSMMSEAPRLEIWRQVEDHAEVLQPGARVKPFDSLQIAYQPAGRAYGMIVSLDGRGRFTLHYPESFNAQPILDQGNPVVLGFAYQLDDAPAFERFFFITSQEAFQVNAVWALLEKQLGSSSVPAAWAADALPNLPAGFDVASFLLKK